MKLAGYDISSISYLSPEQIKSYITQDAARLRTLKEQRRYADGKNVIGKTQSNSQSKIAIPIAKKGVSIFSGYMAKPGNIQYQFKKKSIEGLSLEKRALVEEDGNKEDLIFQRFMDAIFADNNEEVHNMQTLKDALSFIYGFEVLFVEPGTKEPMFIKVKPESMIIHIDPMRNGLDWAINYVANPDKSGQVNVYYPDRIDVFLCQATTSTAKTGQGYKDTNQVKKSYTQLDDNIPFNLTSMTLDLEQSGEHMFRETLENGVTYGFVPVNVLETNDSQINFFDHVKPIIDQADKTISEDVADELASFANAILVMSGFLDVPTEDEDGNELSSQTERIKALKKVKVLDGLDGISPDAFVKWLVKEMDAEFIFGAFDRFERLSYDMMEIVNPNDENFKGSVSGVAAKWRIFSMENKASEVQAYINEWLSNRIRLIHMANQNEPKFASIYADQKSAEISFKRTIPVDDQAKALELETISGSAGLEYALTKVYGLDKEAATAIVDAYLAELAKKSAAEFGGVDEPKVDEEE